MKIKIDFKLNSSFTELEMIIFDLVLNGIHDIKIINDSLAIFSNEVVAISLMNLVNRQVLSINSSTRSIYLSDAIVFLVKRCCEYENDITMPVNLNAQMHDNTLLIKDKILKETVMYELSNDVDLAFLNNCIDIFICKKEDDQHAKGME